MFRNFLVLFFLITTGFHGKSQDKLNWNNGLRIIVEGGPFRYTGELNKYHTETNYMGFGIEVDKKRHFVSVFSKLHAGSVADDKSDYIGENKWRSAFGTFFCLDYGRDIFNKRKVQIKPFVSIKGLYGWGYLTSYNGEKIRFETKGVRLGVGIIIDTHILLFRNSINDKREGLLYGLRIEFIPQPYRSLTGLNGNIIEIGIRSGAYFKPDSSVRRVKN